MEQWVGGDDADRGKPNYPEKIKKTQSLCHSVHHKSYTDYAGQETGHMEWQTGDCLPAKYTSFNLRRELTETWLDRSVGMRRTVRRSNPDRGEILRKRPDLSWDPPRSSPGVKGPRRGVDHSPPSSAEVKERIRLYLQSPLGLRTLFYGELYHLPYS